MPATRLQPVHLQFRDLFTEHSAEIKELENPCKTPFAVRFTNEQHWLPVTIRVAQADGRYGSLCYPEIGIIVCWNSDDEIAILSAATWGRDRASIAYIKAGAFCITSKSQLLVKMEAFHTENTACLMPLANISDRVILQGLDTMAVEATSSQHLLELVTSCNFIKCPEGCKADFGFSPSVSDAMLLALQLKSSGREPKNGDFSFKLSQRYEDMLVVMHHVTAGRGIFIAPGSLLPDTGVSGTWTGKYSTYLIPDGEVEPFLKRLYQAVLLQYDSCIWPSGKFVEIRSLHLQSPQDMRLPVHALHQIEHSFAELCRARLPDILHSQPPGDGTTVDRCMDHARIQDKLATINPSNRNSYAINLCKALGRTKRQPYKATDFDALFIHMPDRQSFYLISAKELAERGYLNSDANSGKFTLGWTPASLAANSTSSWMEEYRFSYDQPNIEMIVKKKLAEFKS